MELEFSPAFCAIEYTYGNMLDGCETIIGEIPFRVYMSDVDGEEEINVASGMLFKINLSQAWRDDVNLEDELDRYSETLPLLQFLDDLYYLDEETELHELLNAEKTGFEDDKNVQMLLIDRVVVEEEHRGHGLTDYIVRHIQSTFAGGDIMLIKPFPLQFESNGRCDYGVKEMEQDEAFDRLRRYYERIGFKTLSDSEYMLYRGLP